MNEWINNFILKTNKTKPQINNTHVFNLLLYSHVVVLLKQSLPTTQNKLPNVSESLMPLECQHKKTHISQCYTVILNIKLIKCQQPKSTQMKTTTPPGFVYLKMLIY